MRLHVSVTSIPPGERGPSEADTKMQNSDCIELSTSRIDMGYSRCGRGCQCCRRRRPRKRAITGGGPITSVYSSIPAELSMVVLASRDVPTLRRFYRALGWSEQPGASDELCRFQLGPVVLTLYADERHVEERELHGPSHITLVVRLPSKELVNEAYRTAVDAGAEVVSPPTDQSWGGRSSVVADPDGHRWELLWVPKHEPES